MATRKRQFLLDRFGAAGICSRQRGHRSWASFGAWDLPGVRHLSPALSCHRPPSHPPALVTSPSASSRGAFCEGAYFWPALRARRSRSLNRRGPVAATMLSSAMPRQRPANRLRRINRTWSTRHPRRSRDSHRCRVAGQAAGARPGRLPRRLRPLHSWIAGKSAWRGRWPTRNFKLTVIAHIIGKRLEIGFRPFVILRFGDRLRLSNRLALRNRHCKVADVVDHPFHGEPVFDERRPELVIHKVQRCSPRQGG